MKAEKNRNLKSILLGSLLVGVLVVGGTLAYLSTSTTPITNSFTFVSGNDISATLQETNWVADNALNLTPGEEVKKNPTITNTSTANLDVYVAMRVTFQKGDGTTLNDEEYKKLMGMITIDYDATNWKATAAAGPVTIYNYQQKLGKDAETGELFTKVTIKETLTNEDMTWLSDTLDGFKIYIEGAAIQASGYADINAAASDLDALFK